MTSGRRGHPCLSSTSCSARTWKINSKTTTWFLSGAELRYVLGDPSVRRPSGSTGCPADTASERERGILFIAISPSFDDLTQDELPPGGHGGPGAGQATRRDLFSLGCVKGHEKGKSSHRDRGDPSRVRSFREAARARYIYDYTLVVVDGTRHWPGR